MFKSTIRFGMLLAAVSCVASAALAATLTGVNASAFSRWDVNRFGEQNLVGQKTANGVWFDNGSATTDKRWLLFNLNGLCTLNNVKVLNYKNETGRQMKTAPIEYSVDGVNWTTLEASHTFALYSTVDTINFGGVQARFVRFGNPSTGYTNQGTGETQTGLTDVTFDGTRAVENYQEVTNIGATASSYYNSPPNARPATNTVNGSGLTGDTDGDGIQQQRVGANDAWESAVADAAPWIKWDFGAPRNLQNMLVWNYNGSADLGACTKSARVRYSLDGSAWTTLGTGYFVPAWNAANAGASYEQYDEAFVQFNFGGVSARYVILDTMVGMNGQTNGQIALGEVKFYALALNTAPVVEAGNNHTITLPNNSVNLDGTVTDDGLPSGATNTEWSMVSGPGTVTFGNSNLVDTTASFSTDGTYVLRLVASDTALSATDTVTIIVNPEITNVAPAVDAGTNQTITLPAYATLAGTVTDDGIPAGITNIAWTLFSGPGTVTFGNSNLVGTTASFSTSGTYVLRLWASDTDLSTSDTVTIVVNPIPNTAPTVEAGNNQTIMLPTLASLTGTVTDEGWPVGVTNILWSMVSGPGTVTFGNTNHAVTTASFSTDGTYVLQLWASDTDLSTSDTVSIVVRPATDNVAPSVEAGADQTLALPASAILSATVTDDGWPCGVTNALWTMVSGPGTVTFGTTNATATTASFSTIGTYVLRLWVSDTMLSASDTVSIVVNPVPPETQPIRNVNASSFSRWDVIRYGEQNLVGQKSSEGCWFDSSPGTDQRWVLFNLNALVALNSMVVTNYRLGGDPNRQMKTAPIEYSVDGVNWTTLQASHTFKLYAQGGDVIGFNGALARLVRIGSPTHGYTNQASSELRTGLSDVSFAGTPVKQTLREITGITAVASSDAYPWSRFATNTVNGSGLTGDTDGDGIQQQRMSLGADVWESYNDPAPWIKWDFGKTTPLQNMLVWNVNLNGETGAGIKTARIRYSVDGSTWTTLGTGSFLPAWNAGNVGCEQYDEAFTEFNFGGVPARYVMLDTLMNFSGATNGMIGLTEVKFYEQPPAQGTLLKVR
jgi:hypothetical protein